MNGKPFALYEQLLNPAHPGLLVRLERLLRQTHLHVVLIGPENELLDVYEFRNSFGSALEALIPILKSACKEHAGMDFIAATREYEQVYDLMELFQMRAENAPIVSLEESLSWPCDSIVAINGKPIKPKSTEPVREPDYRHIVLEYDSTFRLAPTASDYLLLIRCQDPWSNPPEFVIADFWEFREGDQLLITNREQDYPAPVEQMEEGGPSLWKVLPGDRLAWVGRRSQTSEREPTLLALVSCLREGYVYGEPASPTLNSVMSFGAPTSEPTPEVRRLWMIGFDAAVALGIPRTWQSP